MIWNPFKKKEQTQEGEETQKSSIADKLEKELDALPSVFKAKLQDPVVKERFMNIARRMEADGVNFKSIRQMKKWMKLSRKFKEEVRMKFLTNSEILYARNKGKELLASLKKRMIIISTRN